MSVGATNPMLNLYRRLQAVGLTRAYIRKIILPEWWDDQAADNPAGYPEASLPTSHAISALILRRSSNRIARSCSAILASASSRNRRQRLRTSWP